MPLINDLYFSQYGESQAAIPPVLLIHGVGSNMSIWPPKLRRLPGFRTIALDLPAHGKSGKIACQSIEAYAREVISLLDWLGIYHVILVGHSMGGAIALSIALDHPEIVEGLGLISSGGIIKVAEGLLDKLSNPLTIQSAVGIMSSSLFSAHTSQNIINMIVKEMMNIRHSVLFSDWLACSLFDIRSRVHEINTPTWIAVGEDDQVTPLSYSRLLATAIPEVQLQVIPDSGHMLILEKTGEVAKGLIFFLQSLFPTVQGNR